MQNIVYVDERERTTGKGVQEHLADIKHKREQAVAAVDFNANQHTFKDLKIFFNDVLPCFRNRFAGKNMAAVSSGI